MHAPYDIEKVEPLGRYRLKLTFADGLVSEVDLADKLGGQVGPMFEPLNDPQVFSLATVDKELHTVVWPNGADLAPGVLHRSTPRSAS
jgi:hypothetical protein